MLEAARQAGVRRVIFAASSSAYGDTEVLPKHEGMLPNPLSPYAAGKLAGEHYIQVYARTMGLDGVSLRYFNVFGPRQDPSSPYSGVISLFIKAMSQGVRPKIYGDGSQTRDFTYVANAVAANLAAMRPPQAACRPRLQRRDRSRRQPARRWSPSLNQISRNQPRTRVPPPAPATSGTRSPASTASGRTRLQTHRRFYGRSETHRRFNPQYQRKTSRA